MKFEEMNPAPPVTSTRFAPWRPETLAELALDRVQRPALDLALDAAEVLADEREDEPLDRRARRARRRRASSGPGKSPSPIQ